jgi:hypothetical protein
MKTILLIAALAVVGCTVEHQEPVDCSGEADCQQYYVELCEEANDLDRERCDAVSVAWCDPDIHGDTLNMEIQRVDALISCLHEECECIYSR